MSYGKTVKNFQVTKDDPEVKMTDSGNAAYSRVTKSDTTNYAYRYNQVLQIAGPGQAVNLDGSNDEVTLANESNFDFERTDSFSFACWVKTSATGVYAHIYQKANNGTPNYAGIWFRQTSADKLEMQIYDVNTSSTDYIGRATTVQVNDGSWHFVVATYDGTSTSSGIKLYIDATQRDTTNTGGGSFGTRSILNNITPRIGSGSLGPPWTGPIDEFMVFSKVLSGAEITALYNGGIGVFGDIANAPFTTNFKAGYHFDEGSGTSGTDYSGNSNTATLVNGPTWVTGIVPTADTTQEAKIWSSKDGVTTGERGIQTFGDGLGRTQIDGKTIRELIAGTEYANMNASGFKTFTAGLMSDGTSDIIQLRVQGHSSQTAKLLTYETSAASVVADMSVAGLAGLAGIRPMSDSVTAVRFYKTDGTTVIMDIDSTNSRVGVGTSAPRDNFDCAGRLTISEGSGLLWRENSGSFNEYAGVLGTKNATDDGQLTLRTRGTDGIQTRILLGNTGIVTQTTTLKAATGNETAYTLNYTVNKATSGNDTGLTLNMTDTASPGTSMIQQWAVAGTAVAQMGITGTLGLSALRPLADSTTALQIFKTDGTTNIVTIDTTNSRVGIGATGAPTATFLQLGTSAFSQTNRVDFSVFRTDTSTSGSEAALGFQLAMGPTGTSTASGRGVHADVGIASGIAQTMTSAETIGFLANFQGRSAVTLGANYGFKANTQFTAAIAGTITSNYGYFVDTPTMNSGAITTNYGLYINDQKPTGVTTAYGIYVAGSTSRNFIQGRLGVGTSNPQAKIEILGGSDEVQLQVIGNATQTNNILNIKKSDGTIYLQTTSAGVTGVRAGLSTSYGKVGGVIADFFTDTSVGGAEADIYTTTTAASILGTNGDKIIASYGGNFVTIGTESVQLKVYFGGTAIWDSTAIAVTTGTTSWAVSVEVIRVSSTVVRYNVRLNTTGASGFTYNTVGELTGLTLSNTNILKITGTSSGVGSGTGDIVGKMGYVNWESAT